MRASNIEFEISEKKLHLIPEQALKLITKLKENNIKFTLDNYGAENMSLLNLRQLPFSKIKINRTLISKVIKSTQDEIVIDAIIRLAHGFGISVVAEGIESELHYNKLKQLGCDYCQGHLFSKPVTINNLIKLFKTWDNTMDDSQKMPAQMRATWNGQYNSN
jgi:EAL domain-containing protein (putative c-di-GMP-specific phosphodiesterase class I)